MAAGGLGYATADSSAADSCSPMSNPVLTVRPASLGSLAARHPWVLASSLSKPPGPLAKDAVVDLADAQGRFLGRGFFNPDSRIAVRVLCWRQDETLDDTLLSDRIRAAVRLRLDRLEAESSADGGAGQGSPARRLIFSEADRLSGLIVDAYGPHLVVQVTASAIHARLPLVLETLRAAVPCESILLQIDRGTAEKEGIPPRQEAVWGSAPAEPFILRENGLLFRVDLVGGQKTGHFLDQRQNRAAAAGWIAPNSQVLDVCSYSGGFACTIARRVEGCEVTAIDGSKAALELAAANVELNGLSNVQLEQSDFFEALQRRLDTGESYDAIVLDPPRLAGSRSQVARALAAYHRLNYTAVRLLRPGGILVTCSCSGRVDRTQFHHMLLGVSKRSGRDVQVLEQRPAADDHPSLVSCPETDYLKCFICKIL